MAAANPFGLSLQQLRELMTDRGMEGVQKVARVYYKGVPVARVSYGIPSQGFIARVPYNIPPQGYILVRRPQPSSTHHKTEKIYQFLQKAT